MLEAIVLAGGKGTRLKEVVSDVPKPLAMVAGRPFLEHLLDRLVAFGFDRIILSVGFMADHIINYFGSSYKGVPLTYVIEHSPLGTGGAIKKSFEEVHGTSAVILNGDTFSECNYADMLLKHRKTENIVVGVVHMEDASRYGAVEVSDGVLVGFREKGINGPGIINAGCYALNSDALNNFPLDQNFSFEIDFLQKIYKTLPILVFQNSGKFIDIGVPEDYEFSQTYLQD